MGLISVAKQYNAIIFNFFAMIVTDTGCLVMFGRAVENKIRKIRIRLQPFIEAIYKGCILH